MPTDRTAPTRRVAYPRAQARRPGKLQLQLPRRPQRPSALRSHPTPDHHRPQHPRRSHHPRALDQRPSLPAPRPRRGPRRAARPRQHQRPVVRRPPHQRHRTRGWRRVPCGPPLPLSPEPGRRTHHRGPGHGQVRPPPRREPGDARALCRARRHGPNTAERAPAWRDGHGQGLDGPGHPRALGSPGQGAGGPRLQHADALTGGGQAVWRSQGIVHGGRRRSDRGLRSRQWRDLVHRRDR